MSIHFDKALRIVLKNTYPVFFTCVSTGVRLAKNRQCGRLLKDMTIIIIAWRYRRRTSAQSEPKRTNDAAEEWFAVGPRVADWPVGPTPRGPRHGPRTHTHAHVHTHTQHVTCTWRRSLSTTGTVVGGWGGLFFKELQPQYNDDLATDHTR